MRPRIVVTGVGMVSPIGIGAEAFRAALREGTCAISSIDRFDTTGRSSHAAGLVRGFVAQDYIHPNRLRRMDPLAAQAVAAARLAVVDAGLDRSIDRSAPSPGTGIVFGTAYGCHSTTVRYANKLVERGACFTNPIDFPDSIDGAPAAHIAMELGLQGPSSTLVDGALSGEAALWHAAQAIGTGRAERMLVGSGDELSDDLHAAFCALGLLCRGDERMCPYDVARAGPVPGEGTAVLVLELLDAARARGARIYAELCSVGHGLDPSCPPHRFARDPTAAVCALRDALAAADVAPSEIDVFSGAAASSPEFDGIELSAANEVLQASSHCRLMALKGATGELEAGGVLRVAGAAIALFEGFVPPLLGLDESAPVTRLGIPGVAEDAPLRYILHHTMARGGQSLGLVLARA